MDDDLTICSIFFSTFLLVRVESSYIPKISLLAFLALKKTSKLEFGRRSYNIYSSNLHAENQPPSLFNSGDSYEEDLKIRIWKTTLQFFEFFLSLFLLVRLNARSTPKISFLGALEVV